MNHVAKTDANTTDVATVEQQIEQHAQNIERITGNATIEIGRELKRAQELFRFKRDDGGFEGWLSSRLPHISRSTAYNAVQMFDGVGKYPELWTLSDAAIRFLFGPVSPPGSNLRSLGPGAKKRPSTHPLPLIRRSHARHSRKR